MTSFLAGVNNPMPVWSWLIAHACRTSSGASLRATSSASSSARTAPPASFFFHDVEADLRRSSTEAVICVFDARLLDELQAVVAEAAVGLGADVALASFL